MKKRKNDTLSTRITTHPPTTTTPNLLDNMSTLFPVQVPSRGGAQGPNNEILNVKAGKVRREKGLISLNASLSIELPPFTHISLSDTLDVFF